MTRPTTVVLAAVFRKGEPKAEEAPLPKPQGPSPWAPWNPLQRPE
jgi:hypothetical protein